jgi:hypothetical protein
MLVMVRMHLETLHALAGHGDTLRLLLQEGEVNALEILHSELNPRPRSEVAPTTSMRSLRRALGKLAESIERFNRRWLAYLPSVDLSAVLEKECAVRSSRLAQQGFRPLKPLTLEDLQALLPPLPVLRSLE